MSQMSALPRTLIYADFKKFKSGSGGLPGKPKDLISVPTPKVKGHKEHMLVISDLGRWRQADPQGLLTSQSSFYLFFKIY